MRLDGKVAIVAGAGWGGIGAATAYRFAQEGAPGDQQPSARRKLEQTAENIQRPAARWPMMGDGPICHLGNLVEMARERFGRLDIVVHNAAHAVLAARPTFRSGVDRSLGVTLRGAWLGVRTASPSRSAPAALIVLISTVNATIANPLFGVYSVPAGLNALTRSVALEYGRDGIRCNAIAPGQIVGAGAAPATPMSCSKIYRAIATHLGATAAPTRSQLRAVSSIR
jgi:NAD(P)-dependent dehydrogenase (short-subunit alcohol dehydrogenase family)